MLAVLSVALMGLAGGPAEAAQSTSTQDPPKAEAAQSGPAAADQCSAPSTDSRAIVICTQRPQGYRLNPDVMEARRETHSGGRPVRPGGKPIPDCTAGPAPCTMAGINLIGAALTAVEMAQRIAKGQEVGSMFLTDPHPSEYQLYMMAKSKREAEDAQKAAEAAVSKAKATAKTAPADATAGESKPAGN
ncbi:MAG: hypothetical protein ACJ8F4_09655 [Sphingomonas sp.]